ncbi:hypothetical protein [Myxacorys almedinensis]|uniref:Uncharacterized protein n=1 Tax=Myxacorys almedinensis A TaxID=2690445 RepID=A0A8J8CNK3_9CYAN|nr:hypothetical protein [Myxacorys almedinensis]NDJ18527.1 hypothetical protein [Myxacorys almedinensis A]
MKGLLSALRQSIYRGVLVAVIGLLSWVGMSAIAVESSLASPTAKQAVGQEEVISPDSESYGSREEAYDKAVEAVNNPQGVEKAYEKDLKIFKQENPEQNTIVDSAKEAVKKVAGQE